MNTVPIAFAIDQRVEIPAGVAIFSLLQNAGEDTFYDIFILHSAGLDFTESKIKALSDIFANCRITFREVKDEFVGAYEIRGITEACYYRLLIPELIPEYDKILYSDVDVIIRQDLSGYYNTEMGDAYFAGVNIVPSMDNKFATHVKEIGLLLENGYFNSGSLVFNSKKLLADNIISEFRNQSVIQYKYQDQDIINIASVGKIKSLPLSFNFTTSFYQVVFSERSRISRQYGDEEIKDSLLRGTIHFTGAKPWKEVCLNMDIWWDYYRRSPFFDAKFAFDFWYEQTYRVEKMSLMKRIKLVGRYFRKGGRK